MKKIVICLVALAGCTKSIDDGGNPPAGGDDDQRLSGDNEGGDLDGGDTNPATISPNCTPFDGAFPALRITEVERNFSRPVLVTHAKGDNTRLYVVEQDGLIKVVKNGDALETPFLDLVAPVNSNGNEQGLLGLAFHPNYVTNGRFFVHYTDTSGGDHVIAEFRRSPSNSDVADPTQVQLIKEIEQPETNHNAGAINFGADGLLYIPLGDGGGGCDQFSEGGNAQDPATLLGKILRLNVDGAAPYTIPLGNVTAGGFLPEVWAIGMRNPFRSTFDVCTGDLYIGDVGQYTIEEIDVIPAGDGGRNYGWRREEGSTRCFPSDTLDCYDADLTTCTPAYDTYSQPVAQYDHGDGAAVIGGAVYRGAINGLRGTYFYADYYTGNVWTFRWTGGAVTPVNRANDLSTGGHNITSFGNDAAGELYFTTHGGRLYRIDEE
jgi:glucose/arabinose dehydrogenase